MSSYRPLLPSAARGALSPCRTPALRERSIAPSLQQVRGAKTKTKQAKPAAPTKKDRKGPKFYLQKDSNLAEKYALCDAMRYIRAFEVGRAPQQAKYELHIRLKTMKDSPVIRNMIKFPHSVATDSRVCVICPPGSRIEKEAKNAGAVLTGEDEIFEQVKNGKIEFDRCLAHPDSVPALNKSGVGRVLGPRGLMPSPKTHTVVEDIGHRVSMLRGGFVYREKDAVVRLAVGQLGFSPHQLRENLRATLDQIKGDAARLSDRVHKQIHEVVLSSSHSPGFSLNGEFQSDKSVAQELLGGS